MSQEGLIDRAVLELHCDHDTDLLQEILSLFIESFAHDLQQVEQSLQTSNIQQTHFLLHRMKGSLQVLGARQTLQMIEVFTQRLTADQVTHQDTAALLEALHDMLQAARSH